MHIMRKVGRPQKPIIRTRGIIGNDEREFTAGYSIEEPHGVENRRNQEVPAPSGLNRCFIETVGVPAGTSVDIRFIVGGPRVNMVAPIVSRLRHAYSELVRFGKRRGSNLVPSLIQQS